MPALMVLEHTIYIYIYECMYLHIYINKCICIYIYICKYAYIHGFKMKMKLYNIISWGGMQIEYASIADFRTYFIYIYIYVFAHIHRNK